MLHNFGSKPLHMACSYAFCVACLCCLLLLCQQVGDDANVMLNGFGTVVNALGKRAKPYLPQICGTIKWRLNNKAAKIRQQAADLIARIAPVLKACEEEQLLIHLGVVLYEYLGEEVGGSLADDHFVWIYSDVAAMSGC
jgi:hypothetical protein